MALRSATWCLAARARDCVSLRPPWGVPLADTVAIGDSDNDLTVNEVAGIGIAMGNGEQCAKDAADWVADAVDASGLAHAFERLGVV